MNGGQCVANPSGGYTCVCKPESNNLNYKNDLENILIKANLVTLESRASTATRVCLTRARTEDVVFRTVWDKDSLANVRLDFQVHFMRFFES